MRPPRTAVAALMAVALTAGALAVAGPVLARHPAAPHHYGAGIEPLSGYEPQTTCNPRAKPGVVAFGNLLAATWPKRSTVGISRACSVGGTSEHKEGRALDWMVSAGDAADRRKVDNMMEWLLATDRHGNAYAKARRLGIQYMIWNRRIWRAYSADSGWQPYTGSVPHTDHVHFSFSCRGARQDTSFWTGTTSDEARSLRVDGERASR